MAAETDDHQTSRIYRIDDADAGHERRKVMARTDEQTEFPHRVCAVVNPHTVYIVCYCSLIA